MQMATGITGTKLNDLFCGELSAVEAYCQAIENVKNPKIVAILQETHNGHAMRANALAKTLRALGNEPYQAAGEAAGAAWSAFTEFMQSNLQKIGDKQTIAILEEGEDQGMAQYRNMLADTDPLLRQVARDLFPQQESTHNIMRDLKLSLV
jgi:uncharacterized protein (TIGR02284 family)